MNPTMILSQSIVWHITHDIPKAASASSGAATIGMESKNKATYNLPSMITIIKTYHEYLTEQNTSGVMIHVR